MSHKKLTKEKLHHSLFYLRRSLQYFKPYTSRVVISFLSMLVVAGCMASIAFLVKPVLDDIFINKDKQALLYMPFLVVFVFSFKGLAQLIQNYFMKYCGFKVLEQLRNELYSKLVRLPIKFYDNNHVGVLMSRIINDVNLIKSSLPQLIMIFRQILTMIALLFVVFYRNSSLAIWALIILPLALYPIVFLGNKLRKVGRKNLSKIADISTLLQEIFSGVRIVKAFATENGEIKRFQKQNDKLVRIALKGAFYQALSTPIMEFIGALGMGFVIWYGGNQVIQGHSTPGTFFSFMTALMMLYDPFKKISKSNLTIQKALAGAERVFNLLDAQDITIEEEGQEAFQPPFKRLEFSGVTFSYSSSYSPALEDISLNIKAQERIAIVGPSGAGKTTLINLIPRFYDPQVGSIYLNDIDLRQYTLWSLRRSIGIVSQEPVLFNTTIRENICYGWDQVKQSTLEHTCQTAYAHDFIKELPHEYDTIIGERGTKLSGGQKQRLTIARALLKNPPLLILDEATSALDTESERIVQRALENLMQDRTSIVIAHRLSTILSADRIVVMQNGRIVDIGTHSYLFEYCPLYKKLYLMQFEQLDINETLE